MKKNFLLPIFLFSFLSISVNAEILFTDFGEGLAFPMNETSYVDLNLDGISDFKVNSQEGRLGLLPIFGNVCFAASVFYNSEIGGHELLIMEPGQIVGGALHFVEDDDLPLFGENVNAFAEWTSNEANYIGFMHWSAQSLGWMKIRIDVEEETLYILSWAYDTDANSIEVGAGQIIVEVPDEEGSGESSLSDVNDFTSINSLQVFPNPVQDLLQLEFEMVQSEKVVMTCYNAIGQKIFATSREIQAGTQQEILNMSQLDNGLYHLVITSGKTILNRKIQLAK